MIDWLLLPAVGFSLLLALIYTAAVHFLFGLGYRGFLRHWLLAIIGMAVAYALAQRAGSRLPRLGDIYLIEPGAGAIFLLVLAGLNDKLNRNVNAQTPPTPAGPAGGGMLSRNSPTERDRPAPARARDGR